MMTNKRKSTGVLSSILKKIDEKSLACTRNRMLIASKIATALKGKGMTQKEFALKMGKTESEVSEWLSGDRNFTIDTLTEISLSLNISLLNVSQLRICTIPDNVMCKTSNTRITPIKYKNSWELKNESDYNITGKIAIAG